MILVKKFVAGNADVTAQRRKEVVRATVYSDIQSAAAVAAGKRGIIGPVKKNNKPKQYKLRHKLLSFYSCEDSQ